MKKRANKQPVDDLFVRKLENMSLLPSPDSFARLQVRMGQRQPEARPVFWRNPAVQQYVALAACVMLCLFGWLYLSMETTRPDQTAVAVNELAKLSPKRKTSEQLNRQPAEQVAATQPVLSATNSTTNQTKLNTANLTLPKAGKPRFFNNQEPQLTRLSQSVRKLEPDVQNLPVMGSAGQAAQATEINSDASPAETIPEKQVAVSLPKSVPVTERVLIVTIAEPEALVAARQAVTSTNEGKVVVATASKPEPEARTATIWQQVKRIKQGEVFARKDAGNDERGLIGRAYSGLKQTLDKDKSVKQ